MRYTINREKTDGKYNEVHTITCSRLPVVSNRINLGDFNNAIEAVNYAKSIGFHYADGCYYCCREANRG